MLSRSGYEHGAAKPKSAEPVAGVRCRAWFGRASGGNEASESVFDGNTMLWDFKVLLELSHCFGRLAVHGVDKREGERMLQVIVEPETVPGAVVGANPSEGREQV